MKEFFGIGGYQRPAEGAYSWQHLTFVTVLVVMMIAAAIVIGNYFKNKDAKEKNKVLIVTAIAINAFELIKTVVLCIRCVYDGGAFTFLDNPIVRNLPLFLCSIQLIAIPLAAFTRGRMKEGALDFVAIFGLLGALFGTYGAAQNYGSYPVLGMDNVVSGITHTLAGFAALYIFISGMKSLKTKNMWITFTILGGFCVAAYGANHLFDYNYMFLMSDDGTPYSIFYNLVGGHPVLYPLIVVALFLVYIALFYLVHYYIDKAIKGRQAAVPASDEEKEEALIH